MASIATLTTGSSLTAPVRSMAIRSMAILYGAWLYGAWLHGAWRTAAVHEEPCCAREDWEVHVYTQAGLPRPGYWLAASLAKYSMRMPAHAMPSSR